MNSNIILLSTLGIPSGLLLSYLKILYAFIIFLMRATCPVQLILLDVITLIIFVQAYNL